MLAAAGCFQVDQAQSQTKHISDEVWCLARLEFLPVRWLAVTGAPGGNLFRRLRQQLNRTLAYGIPHPPSAYLPGREQIRNRLKALGLPRYKFMVQVVLGEMRLEGVR